MQRPGIASAHGAPSLLDRLAERIYARSGRPVFAAIAVVALVNTTIATAAGVLTAIPILI